MIDINNPDSLSRIITLTFGKMEDDNPYWAYVAIKPSRYDEFCETMASLKYNIQDFTKDNWGEVIVSGEGDRPPSEITKQVAEMFDKPITDFFVDPDPKHTILEKIDAFKKEANNQ